MSTEPRFSKILSSHQMENLEVQEKVISLGKLIINEISSESEKDILVKWIVFYIAEQLNLIELKEGKEKEEAKWRCFESILKLWKHRFNFPHGKYPFARFEEIFKTLEKLNPENENPFFYNRFKDEGEVEKTKDSTKKWLEIAKSIDESARIWIEYVFREAAQEIVDEKMISWIESSIESTKNDDISVLINILPSSFFENEEMDEEIIEEKSNQLIRSRIEKLKRFNEFNNDLVNLLEKKLTNPK